MLQKISRQQSVAILFPSCPLNAFAYHLLSFHFGASQHCESFAISLVFKSCICNVLNYLIPKENFLCGLSMHFCQLVIYRRACFGGRDTWLKLSFIHVISLDFLFFITVSALGEKCFCQTAYLPLHIWFQGEFEKGMIA